MRPFPADDGQESVVGRGLHDLHQTVGPTLCCAAEVVGALGDEERIECGAEECGCLGVQQPVQRGHAVHQRGERHVATVELLLRVGQRSVRVDHVLQVLGRSSHVCDRCLTGEVGEHLNAVGLALTGQVSRAPLDGTQVVVGEVPVAERLDRVGEQVA